MTDELFDKCLPSVPSDGSNNVVLRHTELKQVLYYQYGIDIDGIVTVLKDELGRSKISSINIVDSVYRHVQSVFHQNWFSELHSVGTSDSLFHRKIESHEKLYFTLLYKIYLNCIDDYAYDPKTSALRRTVEDKGTSFDERTFENRYKYIAKKRDLLGEAFNVKSAHNKRKNALNNPLSFVENFLSSDRTRFSSINYYLLGVMFSETYSKNPFRKMKANVKKAEKEENEEAMLTKSRYDSIRKDFLFRMGRLVRSFKSSEEEAQSELEKKVSIMNRTQDVDSDRLYNYLNSIFSWFLTLKEIKSDKTTLLTHLVISESFVPVFTAAILSNLKDKVFSTEKDPDYNEDMYKRNLLKGISCPIINLPNIFVMEDILSAFNFDVINKNPPLGETMEEIEMERLDYLTTFYYPISTVVFILTLEKLLSELHGHSFDVSMVVNNLISESQLGSDILKLASEKKFHDDFMNNTTKNIRTTFEDTLSYFLKTELFFPKKRDSRNIINLYSYENAFITSPSHSVFVNTSVLREYFYRQ